MNNMNDTSVSTPYQVNPKKRELPSPDDRHKEKQNSFESDLGMSTSSTTSDMMAASTDPQVSREHILSDSQPSSSSMIPTYSRSLH